MKIALVEGLRREAAPGLRGECPVCGSRMVSRCGEHRVRHWAHYGERHCDPWWEETEWHRTWKSRFPVEWQEIVQWADGGEKHIADVKTVDGRVIEFQHSPLTADERRAREAFYKSMLWVVDGLRRKRDSQRFHETLRLVSRSPLVYSTYSSDCALLRDWSGSSVDVFFDFGPNEQDISSFGVPVLWQLQPASVDGPPLLRPVRTEGFIAALHNSIQFGRVQVNKPAASPVLRAHVPPYRGINFQAHMYRQRWRRRHFRF